MRLDGPAARLAAARSIAWAVHTSAWLVLAAVGAREWPLRLGGLLPTALWLALLAALVHSQAGRALPAAVIRRAWWLAAGLLAVAGFSGHGLWLAPAWAAAAAASGWTVRLLRGERRSPWHHAWLSAVAGVAAGGAFSLPGVLGSPAAASWGGPALAVGASIGAGAWLARGRGVARLACRWGGPDEWRALQGLDARGWRAAIVQPGLPQRLAGASMLPMMAGLPTLLALCSTGTSPAAVVALHLGAMVLPALCLAPGPLRNRLAEPAWPCAGLLIAGGLALPALPLFQGLMVAALLHAAAWSLAWAAGLHSGGPRTRVARTRVASAGTNWVAPGVAAGVSLGSVAALGLALAWLGPRALWLTHAGLALGAAAWVLVRAAVCLRLQSAGKPPAVA